MVSSTLPIAFIHGFLLVCRWRIFPVYAREFFGALDTQLLYVFDVRKCSAPELHRVLIVEEENQEFPLSKYDRWNLVLLPLLMLLLSSFAFFR